VQAVQAAQVEVQQSDQPESELLGGTGSKPNDDDQKQGEQKNDDDQKQGEQKQGDGYHADESTKIAAMIAAKAAAEEFL